MTIALVLSGGGSKGDFELGAIRYLYDRGIRPDVITGTSVGAINAAKLAEGEGGLEGLERIWESLQTNSDMYTPASWVTGLPPEIRSVVLGEAATTSLAPPSLPPVTGGLDPTAPATWLIQGVWMLTTGADLLEAEKQALTVASSLFELTPIRDKLCRRASRAASGWGSRGTRPACSGLR